MNESGSPIECTAAAWLARRDGDHWSRQDDAELTAWLAQDTVHRVAFLRLEATWREIPRLKVLTAGLAGAGIPPRGSWEHSPYFAARADAWAEPGPEVPLRQRARGSRWPLVATVAAAVCVVVIGLAAAVLHGGRIDRGEWKTGVGAQHVVQLTDGSTATLGADSELRAILSRRERDLYLTRGEAFFDVAHDPGRPFVVHVDGYRVTAVGTRFDVLREQDSVRVVVMHGRVRLQSAHAPIDAATMLGAGSIAVVARGDLSIRQVSLDEARDRLNWRSGYATFHQTSLAEAVREFNRYNASQIVISDPSLDSLRVGGHFRLDNGEAFVRLMQQIFPIAVEQRGTRVVLSRSDGKKSGR